MGIQIGGGGFDASPFLALQRQQQEDWQRAQDRADAINHAQNQQSLDAQGFGATLLRQQDQEQQALARHAADVARQQTQQDFENTQHQAAFDRAGLFHKDQIAQTAKIHADSLAENERVRTANLAERQRFHDLNADTADLHLTGQLADKAAADDEFAYHRATAASYDAAKHGLANDAAYYKAEAEMHRQKAAAARQGVMNERRPWETPVPKMELLDPQFALPDQPVSPPEAPAPQTQTGLSFSGDPNEPPTPLFGGDTGAPDWSPPEEPTAAFQPGSQAGLQAAAKNFERMTAKAAALKQREDSAKALAHRFDIRQTTQAANNPQAIADLALSLRKQITPALLTQADPTDAYEFAKATGRRLPPGTNQLQDDEMRDYAAYAAKQIPLGQLDPNTTPEMLWDRAHRGAHTTHEIIAAAKSILPAVKLPETLEQQPTGQGANAVFNPPRRTEAPPKPKAVTKAIPGAWPTDKDQVTKELLAGTHTMEVPEPPLQLPDKSRDTWYPNAPMPWSDDPNVDKDRESIKEFWNRYPGKWTGTQQPPTEAEIREAIAANQSPRPYDANKLPAENRAAGYMDAADRAAWKPKAAQEQLPPLYRTMSNEDLQRILADKGNPAQVYARQELEARRREGAAQPTKQGPAPQAQPSKTGQPTALDLHLADVIAQAKQMGLSKEETQLMWDDAKAKFLQQNK